MPLSDDDLALVLDGKAQKLVDGHKSREQVVAELVKMLADEDLVVTSRGPLQSQGRVSFGRSNEGREGVALFLPADDALAAEVELG